MTRTITIATRKSELALWQANHVAGLLRDRHPGLQVELLPMVTQGDVILDKPLAQIGGKGLFLKELERALLKGDADIAVHSMKDVPVDEVDGLVVDVMLERANPFDALVSRDGSGLDALPPGARVGTSSLRRQCQLRALRPDLQVLDLRGNVNTRVRKLREGQYEAIVLACAGLERLGMEDIRHTLIGEVPLGWKQKLAFSVAIFHRPVLVFLDEPTTGLDPRSKREVQAVVEELRDEYGTTMLLTTHDMQEADKLSDRGALINEGKIRAMAVRRRVPMITTVTGARAAVQAIAALKALL